MTRHILTGLFASFVFLLACSTADNSNPNKSDCNCDTLKTKQTVTDKNFNRISRYDTTNFARVDFYSLDSDVNRILWYRDVENIDTTKFTSLWDDYSPANYHASQLDFVKYYQGKKDIELAFQFGPNEDLWAYHIFIVKKVGCCYLITRSYFRHARFTYKAYSIMNGMQVDTLYSILKKINFQPVGSKEEFRYCGYFVDNRNEKNFFIDFEKEMKVDVPGEERTPKKEINNLYKFVDEKINWTNTYSL